MPGLATQPLDHAAAAIPPSAVRTLLARAQSLAASGRPDAARPLLGALRRLGGDPDEADALEARLLIQSGQPGEAAALLGPAIERTPNSSRLRLLRAEARLLGHDAEGAARDAAEAVIAEPDNAQAKATLGVTLADLGCMTDALPCLAEAVRNEPAHPGFRLALSRAQDMVGEHEDSVATLQDGIALAPHDLPLRHAAVQLALLHGDAEGAVAQAEAARQAGIVDAPLFGLQAQALASLGLHQAAGDAYAEALKLAPEDPYFRHMAASSLRLPMPAQAPDAFVRQLFEGAAARFDADRIAAECRVPVLLRAALEQHVALPPTARMGSALGPALDLGCGTGRAATAMADLPIGPWHGIDLSPSMLRQARRRGVYETLHEGSIVDGLAQQGPDYALALAADSLCYGGALAPALAAVQRRLLPRGWLLASFEALPPGQGWKLRPAGHYAHAPEAIAEAAGATGFEVVAITAQTLRHEASETVDGLIVVLRKAVP